MDNNVQQYINNWMENKTIEYYIFLVFLFLMIDYFLKKIFSITKNDILEHVEENIDDNIFRKKILNLIMPRVGEVVQMANSPWNGLFGYVTKIEDDNYNIKLTKSLNPETNRIPKRRISRPVGDIYID